MSKESVCVVAATRGAEIRIRVVRDNGSEYTGRLLPEADGWFMSTGTLPDHLCHLTSAMRDAGIKHNRGRAAFNGPTYVHVDRIRIMPEDAEVLSRLGWVEPGALGEAIDGLRMAAV